MMRSVLTRPETKTQPMPELIIGPGSTNYWHYSKAKVSELYRFRSAVGAWVVNLLRRKYRRSALGFLWSLITPFLNMLVLTIVFSSIFKRPTQNFAIYILSATLAWSFMQQCLIQGCSAILSHETYLKKVYLPKAFFPLVVTCAESINFVLSSIAFLVIAVAVGTKFSFSLLLIPAAWAVTFLFLTGACTILSILTIYYRDLAHICGVILSALFYLAPIVYPMELLPQKVQFLVYLNPLYYFLRLFRTLIYEAKFPSAIDWLIPCCIAAVCILSALRLLQKREQDLIYRL